MSEIESNSPEFVNAQNNLRTNTDLYDSIGSFNDHIEFKNIEIYDTESLSTVDKYQKSKC